MLTLYILQIKQSHKMTSTSYSIDSFAPLDGSNWIVWSKDMLALLVSRKLGRIVLGQKVRPIWTIEDDAEITNKRKLVPGHAASAATSTSAAIPAWLIIMNLLLKRK